MTISISDFSDAAINAVQTLVNTRYGEETELQLGDCEVQLDPARNELSECPVIYWNARDCNFVVLKTGEDQYRAQYYYNPREQLPTRQPYFTTVEDCVTAVLREQSDHERESKGVKSGMTGADLN